MKALILVDIQNDFMPTGALPVPKGDEVIAVANRLQRKFDLIVATQDWHPRGHGSFATSNPPHKPGEVVDLHGLPQVLWPDHCVQETAGADFVPGLDRTRIAKVFRKGADPTVDSYSGFFDNGHRQATGLGDWLKENEVDDVYVCGVATDYCVKFTALDARQLGFTTTLVEDACRAVNRQPGDDRKALDLLRSKGVRVAKSTEI